MKLFWIIICWSNIAQVYAQIKQIQIPAVPYERTEVPVVVKSAAGLPTQRYFYLQHTYGKELILAQKINANEFVFIPETKIPANTSRVYKVLSIPRKHIKRQPAPEKVTFVKAKDGIWAMVRNKQVFVYRHELVYPPADSPHYYKRSGFIHPLRSPGGAVLTDDFPAGHTHQHAIFTAWTNTTFRNSKVDFWNQQHQTGTVMHSEIIEMVAGDVFGQLRVRLFHNSLKEGTVLEEIWNIRLYALKEGFLFDLESEQTNITSDTLFLHQYIYGGLAFRGAREWNKHDPQHRGDTMQVSTSEGYNKFEANHQPARFVTTYGKINDSIHGVTIFDHPENFRYPQPIRVHPEMPYWAYSPVVAGAFTIDPGKKYKSKYRYFVFNGKPDTEKIRRIEMIWRE